MTPRKAVNSSVKRRRYLQLVGASSTIGLAGCTGNDGSENTPTDDDDNSGGGTGTESEYPDLSGEELLVLFDEEGGDIQSYYDHITTGFEDLTGATVNLEVVGFNEKLQRISSLLQAGDAPELVFSSPPQITRYAREGVAAPVNEVVERQNQNFGEAPDAAYIEMEGDHFAVPYSIKVFTTIYREDIFDERPTDWDSFLAQAKEHDDPDGIRGTSVPAGQELCNTFHVLHWLKMNDVNLATRDDNGDIEIILDQGDNRERVRETLSYLKDLHQYSPEGADAGCAELVSHIPQGVTASANFLARHKLIAVNDDLDYAADVRTAPPVNPSEGSANGYALTKAFHTFEQANVEAAIALLKYLTTEEIMVRWMNAVPMVNWPIHPELAEGDLFEERVLSNLPDAWSEEDIEGHKAAAADHKTVVTETSPPNAQASSLVNSGHVGLLLQDVLIRDTDIGTAIDNRADKLREALD